MTTEVTPEMLSPAVHSVHWRDVLQERPDLIPVSPSDYLDARRSNWARFERAGEIVYINGVVWVTRYLDEPRAALAHFYPFDTPRTIEGPEASAA